MITVVGTGLAGLTMTASLLHQGFNVTCIGPQSHNAHDARTTAILQPNIDFLKQMGLWDTIAGTATPLITLELNEAGAHSIFDASEMNLDQFGYNIRNQALRDAVAAHLKTYKKNLIWHDSVVKQALPTPNGWQMYLANNQKLDSAFVIAADGRDSTLRHAADIDITERNDNQTALVGFLSSAKPHHYTSVEWYTRGGTFTLVPCQSNRFALVWCDNAEAHEQRLTQPLTIIADEITALTEKRFGRLEPTDTLQPWKLRPMQAKQLVKPHLALIGEAAHVLPPIGAQGFNTSLYDIQTLLSQIAKAQKLGLPVYDAGHLKQYKTTRQRDIAMRYHGITRFNDIVRLDGLMGKTLRRGMIGALNHIKPLRHLVMKTALGPIKVYE
jgi:2-octaprenyl-6-methoxyphenol hydroxylase